MTLKPEPKGPRAAIARLVEHLNRHPDDVGLFMTGAFVVLLLLLAAYSVGWHMGYDHGQEAAKRPPATNLYEMLQENRK